jgi:predicted regulator of amino acid metabolism with ACT domain
MTDRQHADAVLEHVAVLAFLYYPGIQVDDPTYRLTEDTEWCLARLGDVTDTEREQMRALIARAIIDPTGTREELFTAMAGLNGVHGVGHHA